MNSEETITVGERALNEVTFKLTKTKDELKLFVAVHATDNFLIGSLDINQLKQLFHDVPNPHEGVLKAIVEELKPGLKLEPRRISKGEAAIAGRDGKLLLLVKPFNGNFRAGELERVDPKFVRAFDNIEVGSVVARIYPPTAGTPGRNCFGGAISPTPGKPFQAELDSNTLSKREAHQLEEIVSTITGYLAVAGNKLKIEHTLEIKKEVGYQTGDIDFIGAVTVSGDVKKDFKVEADSEVVIKGGVNGGALVSRKSSVFVQGAVIGDLVGVVRTSSAAAGSSFGSSSSNQRSEIIAKTSITALSIENVFVECGGDLIVEREIRKCSVVARGAIRIPKGSIVGGDYKVVCGLEALNLGNVAGGDLKITLLSDIESGSEYVELKNKIERHLHAEHALELHLGPIAFSPGRTHRVSESHQSKTRKLLDDYNLLKKSRMQLEQELELLLSGAHFNQALRVNVIKALYPGVTLRVGAIHFEVDSVLEGPKTIEFLQSEQKFEVHQLVPVLCDLPNKGILKNGD